MVKKRLKEINRQFYSRKNRGVLKIHEITTSSHKMYEKKNKKSKNKLIYDKKRGENPFLKNSYNLLDYIKNK